jgi:hypothetical protein
MPNAFARSRFRQANQDGVRPVRGIEKAVLEFEGAVNSNPYHSITGISKLEDKAFCGKVGVEDALRLPEHPNRRTVSSIRIGTM